MTNSVTGAGIGGAQVTAQTAGPPIPTVTTDDGGLFPESLTLPDGPVHLFSYSKEGYYPARVAGPAPVIRVSGDAHVDLRMIPRASLQGRVLDPEGKPAQGITVTLDSFGVSAITDEDGVFKIQNVKPGQSRLSAKPKSQAQAQDKNGEKPVTTYYPSIIDSTQAVWVEVRGVDLFGYDIRLQAAPARRVRGMVLDAGGRPAAHATLTLLRPAYRRVVFINGLVRSVEPPAQTGGRIG